MYGSSITGLFSSLNARSPAVQNPCRSERWKEEVMKQRIILLLLIGSASAAWASQTKEDVVKRLQRASEVMTAIQKTPDKGIPSEVLDRAKCIAVVPSMVKAGLGIGGQHGRGAVTCRTANGWSAPSLFTISGASLGFQIGGQAVDLILAIMNEKGMRNLLSSKFELGGDASVAAGPVGRHAEAGTDVAFNAEILTYSRARGAFAGVSLKGAFVRQDDDSTKALYGRQLSYEDILSGKVPIPAAAQPFIAAIRQAKTTTASKKK